MNVFGERYVPVGSVEAPDGELVDAIDSVHARPVALLVRGAVPGAGRDELVAQTRALMSAPAHPNVATVRDAFFSGDRYVVVMDRAEGRTLAGVLAARGEPGLPVSVVLGYLEQLAAAVDHLHGQRPPVVHGDIRPERVWVTAAGAVVLMCAGAGSGGGTAGDIAGFGATAVQLLTGCRPGTAGDAAPEATLWQGVDPDAAKHLGRILRRALDPDPARRPGSAGALVERLRAWRSGDLPGGEVTFLLTDIEGSTGLWEAHPAVMGVVIARHHEIVADGIDAHDGRQPRSQGEGDSTLSVFARATDAVRAALAVQRALAEEPWAEGIELRVRAGLHTGEAEVRGGDYFGAAVSRTARIRALARGGEVLLSQATAQLAMDRLPAGAELCHVGRRALKGLAREEDIFQLRAPGLVDAPLPVPVAGTGGAAAATRTLPRDIASFTGRQHELQELVDAAVGSRGVVGIQAIGGMAGIGKTAFAVHAAHQLTPRFPAGQIFLPLHGHTPGQRPVDPGDALASLLLTAGLPAAQIPPGLEARTALWRDRLAGRPLLLVLDDAASSEQVLPLLPGSGGSLVLVTSRRHLSALDDARAISLDTLPPEEAAGLLVRLAGRAGLSPADPAVAEITGLCGYLPLAIGMVARQLHHHPAWSAAGRAAELASAVDRLELMATENLSVAAAFNLSYADLTEDQQRLFRRLGLHPGTDVDAYAAAALDGTDLASARRGLEALYDQHLLTEPAQGRYRLHDLIRAHARALAGSVDPDSDRDQATARLLDYYQHTAALADAVIARQTGTAGPAAGTAPPAVPALADLEQALAWARAERASLLACLDHATATGQHARVTALTAGLAGLLDHDGPWSEAIDRHATAVRAAQRLGDRPGQARALTNLGSVRQLTGDYPGAAADQEQALGICRDLGDRPGQASALREMGLVRMGTGDFRGAAPVCEEALGICRELGDRPGQAITLRCLGLARRHAGDYPGAARAWEEALGICRDLGDRPGQALVLTYLGSVRRLTGDYPGAARVLEEALGIYRDIGGRRGQAQALNYRGLLRLAAGDYPGAAGDLEESLGICREIGSRGGVTEVLNSAGMLNRIRGDLHQAQSCYREALEVARQIGSSYDEALALAGLGRCAQAGGHAAQATDMLRQALEIFQRGGAAEAAEVSAELKTLTGARPAAQRS